MSVVVDRCCNTTPGMQYAMSTQRGAGSLLALLASYTNDPIYLT